MEKLTHSDQKEQSLSSDRLHSKLREACEAVDHITSEVTKEKGQEEHCAVKPQTKCSHLSPLRSVLLLEVAGQGLTPLRTVVVRGVSCPIVQGLEVTVPSPAIDEGTGPAQLLSSQTLDGCKTPEKLPPPVGL